MSTRCTWCGTDPVYVAYHDVEWGSPVHDDRLLFEFLVLEGAQAGLSWLTILKKRANYRRAFDDFDIDRVAAYDARDTRRLLADAGIVRNRLKIASAIGNARAVQRIRAKHGSLDGFLWGYVDGRPVHNTWTRPADVPTTSPVARAMSRDLERLGCHFVGPTICYAFMQAVGMVNDHTTDCFRHSQLACPGDD